MNSVEQTEAIDIRSTEKMQKSKIEYRMLEEDCYFRCYHYDGFQTESEGDYEKYNVLQHPGKCVYANKAEIEKSGLKHWVREVSLGRLSWYDQISVDRRI